MPRSYTVRSGDTFESIARAKYGDATKASAIAAANSGFAEPLVTGAVLVLPSVTTETLRDRSVTDSEEVSLVINGDRFPYWQSISIDVAIDRIPQVNFSCPWDDPSGTIRKIIKPFTFADIGVNVGSARLFTGTLMDVSPTATPRVKSLSVNAYGLPGVLNDCTAPVTAYPLEFFKATFKQIADKVVAPFGVTVASDLDSFGTTFDQVDLKRGRKVWDFLTELSRQRNLLLSADARGRLWVTSEATTGSIKAKLVDEQPPVTAIRPMLRSQQYYSSVTGVEPVIVGLDGTTYTVKNSRLSGVTRPYVFEVPDTAAGDVETAVRAKAGGMFASAASYSVDVATWVDESGDLWKPNTFVTLYSPAAMVYNKYKFVIRSVRFNVSPTSRSATLDLVTPGSLSGTLPESMPWDE